MGSKVLFLKLRKMTEYKKLMKTLKKDKRFILKKEGRKNTEKLIHIETGQFYSIHPGDNAVKPLTRWVNKF